MFMVMVSAMLVALVPLLGGDLRRLGKLRLRLVWVIFAALAVQILVISVIPNMAQGWDAFAHVLTYIAGLAVIARNWRLPGLPVIGLGTACNGLAIVANGGTLPASRSALEEVGIHLSSKDFANSGVLAHPHLAWLGDRFATPSWLPMRNVISIGDLLLLVGLAVLLVGVCGIGRSFGRREPAAAATATPLALRPSAPAAFRATVGTRSDPAAGTALVIAATRPTVSTSYHRPTW